MFSNGSSYQPHHRSLPHQHHVTLVEIKDNHCQPSICCSNVQAVFTAIFRCSQENGMPEITVMSPAVCWGFFVCFVFWRLSLFFCLFVEMGSHYKGLTVPELTL